MLAFCAPADNGGHMIGAQFNGHVELINYFPQELNTNRGGDWKSVEDEWDAVLRGNEFNRNGIIIPAISGGQTITDAVITMTFPSSTTTAPATKRPNAFSVTYKYGGVQQPPRPVFPNP